MKATGIVRRIDDLGRIVIPKEIRRTLRIREGDPMEIYTDREGEVILKKYSPIGELNEFASEYVESTSSVLGGTAVITDTDQVIAVAGGSRKEYQDRKISKEIESIIHGKSSMLITDKSRAYYITDTDTNNEYDSQIVVPIVSQGDPIGSVILLSKVGENPLGDAELKAAEIGAAFLAKQMES